MENSNEKELIEKLKNGEFDEMCMDIDAWINTFDRTMFNAILDGCEKANNMDYLYLLYLRLNRRLIVPTLEELYNREAFENLIIRNGCFPSDIKSITDKELVDLYNRIVVDFCERVIKCILKIASKYQVKDESAAEIIEEAKNSISRDVRISACAVTYYPSSFLNDRDERIRKIALNRIMFEDKWKSYSFDEQKLIKLIINAINSNIVLIMDGLVGKEKEDEILAQISSNMFEKSSSWFDMDKDIFYNVTDKRMLADIVYEKLLSGDIKFKEGMEPISFHNIKIEKGYTSLKK